jgi:Protein of unknown function (DUF1360)
VPSRVDGRDVLLLGVATHRLSRMIAKDPILSPIRAPFTTYKGTSGEAELPRTSEAPACSTQSAN